MNGGPDARVRIVWQEAGGPAVRAPQRCGYGMEVIRELVPYQLGGTVDLAFAPGGVSCEIAFPATELQGAQPPCPRSGRPIHSTANTLASSEIS
jgi:two-component sensor histidine kinase